MMLVAANQRGRMRDHPELAKWVRELRQESERRPNGIKEWEAEHFSTNRQERKTEGQKQKGPLISRGGPVHVWISLFDEPNLVAAGRQEIIRYDLPESVRRATSRSRERVMSNLKQSFEAELSEQALKVKHRTLQQKPVRALLRWPALPAHHSRLSWLYL
jgi:hypothetical protein